MWCPPMRLGAQPEEGLCREGKGSIVKRNEQCPKLSEILLNVIEMRDVECEGERGGRQGAEGRRGKVKSEVEGEECRAADLSRK